MLNRFRFHPWLLTLLCGVLLVVRFGGPHLHLCFDGGEPQTSLHVLDGDVHHLDEVAEFGHEDVDLSLAGDVLTKLNKLDLDLLALLLSAAFLWCLWALQQHGPPNRVPDLLASTRRTLRPPLRGPPCPTSC